MRPPTIALLATISIGMVVRLLPPWHAGFVFGDGGLFVLMAEELRANHYALPLVTDYNHLSVPFAYPPFGLYVAAMLADLTGLSLLVIDRWLPSFVATLSIVAFYRLARLLLPDPRAALVGTGTFALMPHAMMLFIAGGGLTRAWGLLFALLTLAAIMKLYRADDWRYVIPVCGWGALTILSHPSASAFAAYSGMLLLAFCAQRWRALPQTAVAAAGVALLTSPWWALVIQRHGTGTLFAAASLPPNYATKWTMLVGGHVTGEPVVPILWLLAIVGMAAEVHARRWLLPLWFALIYIVDPRYDLAYGSVPLALLAGRGLIVFVPLALDGRTTIRVLSRLSLALVVLLVAFGALLVPLAKTPQVSAADLAAMSWVRDTGPVDATYVVISDSGNGHDAVSEWFPALTGHPSIATMQGSEWSPEGHYTARWTRYDLLQKCAAEGIPCLVAWHTQTPATHLYVTHSPMTAALDTALHGSPQYQLIYEDEGASIYKWEGT